MTLKRKTITILGVLLGFALLASVTPAYAQQEFLGTEAKGQLGYTLSEILQYVGVLNTIMHVLILIILTFVQYLLQSDFFTNPMMMEALNNIWRLSRDVMNVLFAVMLIGVALYTIVTSNKKFVTENIMHFVLAVLFVNFSWFYPRIIIDVSNILTATIYSVPQIMGSFTCEAFDETTASGRSPCKVVTDISLFGDGAAQAAFCGAAAGTPSCPCEAGIACYKLDTYQNVAITGSMGVGHIMINGLVVNFAKILTLAKIPVTLTGGAPVTAGQAFVVNLQIIMLVAITFLIQAAVILPLIGLVAGLLIRILILWVTTAFMPFTFLGVVKDGKPGTAVFGFEIDIWKEFLNAAFLPAMVALPITIGFVMLTTVVQIPDPTTSFPMTWNIPLVAGFKSWWPMLWMIAAIGILWKGSFAALSKSQFISGFTEKLKGYGEGLFSAGLQLPLILPLPLPGRPTTTLGGALHGPQRLGEAIKLSARSGKPIKELFDQSGNPNAAQNPLNPTAVKEAGKTLTSDPAATAKVVKAIEDLGKIEINKDTPERQRLIAELKPILKGMDANAGIKDVMLRVQAVAKTNAVPGITNLSGQIQKLVDEAK